MIEPCGLDTDEPSHGSPWRKSAEVIAVGLCTKVIASLGEAPDRPRDGLLAAGIPGVHKTGTPAR